MADRDSMGVIEVERFKDAIRKIGMILSQG
jgi:hypothetical protein